MLRMGDLKYVMRLYGSDELYDLSRDPEELENRINDPAYAKALGEMKEKLLRFYMATGDFVPTQMDKR